MAITQSQWIASKLAAEEYQQFATEIEKIRNDIKLFRQGLKQLVDISSDTGRVNARLTRERDSLANRPAKDISRQERLLGKADFQDVYILKKLARYACSVGRVVLPNGFGTGWLIGPGLMITNHHVLPNRQVAARACVMLDYERREDGLPEDEETFTLRPDLFFMTPQETDEGEPFKGLDFTIVGVAPAGKGGKKLSEYAYIALDGGLGKAIEGENCVVIQHPEGDYKKIVLRDTRLLKVGDILGAEDHIFYESDTLPGSSGSVVIALGTGEVIALHNAAVPRLDAKGNYLKKNGEVFRQGDSEEEIDWMANQGVRVSKIVEAIRTLPLPAEMEDKRRSLLNGAPQPDNVNTVLIPKNTRLDNLPDPIQQKQSFSIPGKVDSSILQRFIVRILDSALAKTFARENILQAFTGSTVLPLSDEDDESPIGKYIEVHLNKQGDPWQLAAQLEAIDGIAQADPDLPQYTTMGNGEFKQEQAFSSSDIGLREGFIWDDGKGKWDERRFISTWKDSKQLAGLNATKPEDLLRIRKWNHIACGFQKYVERLSDNQLELSALSQALSTIRMAQFDTGYTQHSKVATGFNLNEDFDLIDNDTDARDSQSQGILKFPGHGTRTGSIIIGLEDSQDVVSEHEGNSGLLRNFLRTDGQPAVQLTPFRIAKSVILIGRISELVKAVHRAVESGYEVLTMSMGTLANPALGEIARYTYEKGVIWCCAAGNQVRFVVAPAVFPGVICVAASNPDDAPWSGSCRGPEVDITAPGEDIYVPIINEDDEEDMAYGSGTSYATPHVAAAAMLWLAKHKNKIGELYTQSWQRVEAFRYCLQISARKAPDLNPRKFGPGILNVNDLMETELPAPSKLKHAYTGKNGIDTGNLVSLRPFESYTTSKTPLAMRELAYKDWQQVVGRSLHQQTNTLETSESFSGESSRLSVGAQVFGNLLSKVTGNAAGSIVLTESANRPVLASAYQRLLEVNKLNSGAKPLYEKPKAGSDRTKDKSIAQMPKEEQTTLTAGTYTKKKSR